MHASQNQVLETIVEALREVAANFGGNGIRTDDRINEALNGLAKKLEEVIKE